MSEQRDRANTFDTILFVTVDRDHSFGWVYDAAGMRLLTKKSPKICPCLSPVLRALMWKVPGEDEHSLIRTCAYRAYRLYEKTEKRRSWEFNEGMFW